ncbi:hypothetical protein AB0I81_58510 [Nonomuraea sp. NPDC050404]|uniref:hypothetical protein n=1 Tax=Nonomuraea sp. NPDC050404 TaxID=3155783 RepID=UPI0033DF429E
MASIGEANQIDHQAQRRYGVWDPDQRREAWDLDRSASRWIVFYGPYTRQFYAIAAWPSPCPLVLSAGDTAGLRDLMHEAETAHTFAQGPKTA